jgi:peptidyl-prolyl cis-trans isomerase C
VLGRLNGSAGGLLGVALFCAASACSSSGDQPGADAGTPPGGLTQEQAARVIARVGETSITLGDYAAALDRMDPFDRLRYQSVEKRRELLNEMVDLELLAIEAKKRGLDKKPEAEAAVRQVLRDALLDEAHDTLPTPAEIPAADVRAFYDANVSQYREPERRRVAAIVLDDEAKAKEALDAALATKDSTGWGALFYERSITAPADKKPDGPLDLAGDLGIVGPVDDDKGANPRVPEPLRAAAFKLERVGDIYKDVIAYEKKFYVVRLAGHTQAHERTYAEAERQIRVELLKVKMRELEGALEQDLRKKYKVEIDDAALAKIQTELPSAPPPAPSASP